MKDNFKNYSFWISVTGAVLLLLNNLGKVFGFSVNNEAVYSIVDGVCGVLVVFGILTMNKSKNSANLGDEDLSDEDLKTFESEETKEQAKTEVKTNTNGKTNTDDKTKSENDKTEN
ncbi:MAG: hypothetical protein ACI4TZ_04140 [Christensenellales bacterium]